MRRTTVILDKLSKYACPCTLQQACCQAEKTNKLEKVPVKLTTCRDGPTCCKHKSTLPWNNRGKERLEDNSTSVACNCQATDVE